MRNLERQIATVCRKVARRAAEGEKGKVAVSQRSIETYLGKPRYLQDDTRDENEIGVVNGLAWTEAGGDVLLIEASRTRGRGLVLTGHLGDVMKESGQAALSCSRSMISEGGGDDSELAKSEVHVHVPAGATPKDGPSAGVAITTAIVSLATGIPVRSDVAMTGEVTLRGKVLAVGGVREKALAALRSGVKTVLLPRACMRDVEEIPKELKRQLEFVPCTSMEDVLQVALERTPPWLGKRSRRAARGRASAAAPAAAKKR